MRFEQFGGLTFHEQWRKLESETARHGMDEGEEYAQPPGWMGKVNLRPERIRTCPINVALTIDAWDQA